MSAPAIGGRLMGKFSAGWRQVWLCLILMAVNSMVTMTYGIIAVPLMHEFHPSRMVLMMTMSVIAVVATVASPPLGTLMDKVSVRWVVVYGAVSICVGYFLLSFATDFLHILVIYGLFMGPPQVATGAMSASVLLSRWFSEARGRAMGIAIAGISVGGFCFPPLVQMLIDIFAWREAMQVLAIGLAVLTIPAALMVIDHPAQRGLFPDGAQSEPLHADASRIAQGLSNRAILTDPTFWLFALILSIFFSGMRGLVTNVAPLAADQGIDPALIAYLLSFYSAAGVVAKLGFAAIADRVNPRLLMLVSLIGVGVAHGCMIASEQGYAMIALGSTLMGLFGGAILPLQGFLVPRIFGASVVGRVSGLLGIAMFAFNFVTPPLFGLIHDMFGNYDAIFMAYVALVMIGIAVLPRMRMGPREGPEHAG